MAGDGHRRGPRAVLRRRPGAPSPRQRGHPAALGAGPHPVNRGPQLRRHALIGCGEPAEEQEAATVPAARTTLQ